MIPLLVLGLWMASGLLAAIALAAPGEPRTAWFPIALVLGPLWVPVEVDRRSVGRS